MNKNVDIDAVESNVISDGDGLLQEYVPMEEINEEGEEDNCSEDELGFSDDSLRNVIDYSKLEATLREATPVYQLDTDLAELQINEICLLIIVLLLGLIIVGGKGR